MATDTSQISYPQSGMVRDLHPSQLSESQYTFALNANIESEDGNVNMRSNEHSNLRCIGFGDYKVIGYKNDLTSGFVYFFITNPQDKTSKIVYFKPCDDIATLTDEQILSAVSGDLEIGAGLQTLIEDSADDPCLNLSIYHPIKTIEIKTEKCGKCIYWTDGLNPPRYVIVEKALEPDEDGDIWYHYHGYKICGEKKEDGSLLTRDEFIKQNGCVLACEKLRVFPLLEQPCIEPDSIAYGGSLRAGVYQFCVALCDEFGNEKTNYSPLTNPVHIFDEHDITVKDGLWGARTNLGIRLSVTNLDRQVNYFKVAVIQNTVGYNGETQPTLDYFIEGIHPVTEKTIYYYSDLNNQRTTLEHISYKKPYYNTSRGIVAVSNRLIHYGLTAEREWNLQPVVTFMGHFLKWQSSVSTGDLYKDGNACSLYVGYMRDEVYPFGISFRTTKGYMTPIFTLVPPPYKDAKKPASEVSSLSVPVESITRYVSNCYANERQYAWQYMNTCGDGEDATGLDTGEDYNYGEGGECKNETTIKQTFTSERVIEEHPFNNISFDITDVNVTNIERYISDNILDIACSNATNEGMKELCTFITQYQQAEGDHNAQYPMDGIELPDVPTECSEASRQESLLEVPYNRIENARVSITYLTMDEMSYLSTGILPQVTSEYAEKQIYFFDNDAFTEIEAHIETSILSHVEDEAKDRFNANNVIDLVAGSLALYESYPNPCGSSIANACVNPMAMDDAYNSYQTTPRFICSYIFDLDTWCAGNNSSSDSNFSECIEPESENRLFPTLEGKMEPLISKYIISRFSTGLTMDYRKDYTTYLSNSFPTARDTFNAGVELNTRIGAQYRKSWFEDEVGTNAIWFRIEKPEAWSSADFDGEKVVYVELFGMDYVSATDAASSDVVRISYWRDMVGTKLERDMFSIKDLSVYSTASGNSVIMDVNTHTLQAIRESDFTAIGQDYFYVSLDCPFVIGSWMASWRANDMVHSSRGMLGGFVILGKTRIPYVITLRDKEIASYHMDADRLFLKATVTFVSDCVSCGDKPLNCAPRPYRYGDFGYFESSRLYPANYELWDSSRVHFDNSRSYEDADKAAALSEIKEKMAEWYGSPKQADDGLYYYEGHTYGTVDTSTVLCQQPIRHYKFPDNFHTHFMNTDIRTTNDVSEIYPVGILINESIINVFLDYAVDSGLITQEQRDTVCGYELYRGDRRLNKSIVGCGIAYDFFKYTDNDGNTNIYPNYPYNDLSDDDFHYQDGNREYPIEHPFNKDGNVWYSFISPDIFFNKPEIPDEITIDGYMRGISTGNYVPVKEHPKWTILSDQAYRMARNLALVESIAQLMGEIMEEYQLVVMGTSGGILGTGLGAGTGLGTAGFLLGAGFKLGQRATYFGKYFSDWVNIFRNNGPRYNFAWYYTSIGQYTSMFALTDYETYLANSIRGLSTCKMIRQGIIPVSDESNDGMIYINNIFREESMFMSLGDPGTGASGSDFKTVYPANIRSYDTSRVEDLCVKLSEAKAEQVYEITKQSSYIASPYIRSKVYKPDQYGDIEDISWVSIGGNCSMDGKYKFMFGGDTYISKFAIKRKVPEFINNAFHMGDMVPFPYDDYRNIGYPKYFVNFDTGQTEETYSDNESFRNATSNYAGSSYFYPYKYSLYNLNGVDIEDKYVKGRFYLWFYGIPEFYVESDVNCNFRLRGTAPEEQFYPDQSDYIEWTQERNVSIERDNDFRISPIYMSRTTIYQNVLPATYERKFYDCAYQRPNGAIWSREDMSENSQTDPWLTYKPMDYHEFPTSNGKLLHMKRIESDQLLVRFEDQVSLHNAIDVIRERMTGNTEIGTGGLFQTRPLEYNTTDLGYTGTQSTEIVSSEFGHFWVDVKRAQVFQTDPNGRNLQELSVGIRHWLKRHLPFKILKYGITNVQTGETMGYEDVDNKFVGIGLSLGWDNEYKRVFITKLDYIPKMDPSGYKFDGGKFLYNDAEVSLKDSTYFEDVSFTIAYSCLKKEWISYYSFKPDYYIEQQHYFMTGLNYSSDASEIGIWDHLLTNKSYQTFYGKVHPFELEVPLKEKYVGSILSSVEYELDARKYTDNSTYTVDRKVGLDSIIIYNETNNSGELVLIPEEKNNMSQKLMYPRVVDGHTEILDTEVYRRHKLNDFFNRIEDDRSEEPVWEKDENDIEKTLNTSVLTYSQGWLDRLRGSWMLMRLKKVIQDRKIIFQWVIGEDKRKNR